MLEQTPNLDFYQEMVKGITVENGKIVIAPIRNRFRLEDLLAGVTPENKHAEIDFGQSVCRETL